MRNRKKYPANWRALSLQCKERAQWKCEECGVEQGTIKRSIWSGNEYKIYLQAAHVHHDRENPNPELKAVCAYCHWHKYRAHKPAWYIEKIKHRILLEKQGYRVA